MRRALALLALVTVGCGIGRSKMLVPPMPGTDAAVVFHLPDSSLLPPDTSPRDTLPPPSDGPFGPEVLPPRPDVVPLPDGPPPVNPDYGGDLRRFDLPSETTPLPTPDGLPLPSPDLPPDGIARVPPDGRLEAPPLISPDGRPEAPPPVSPDALPDGLPPPTPDVRPDGRPPRPDTAPPAQDCTAGAACTADCTTSCNAIGSMACACTNGVLSCGTCQVPPITVSQQPCPDNPTGTDCSSSGLACFAFSNGAISGACLCLARGNAGALRWACILR